MKQLIFASKISSVSVVNDQVVTIDIPRQYDYESLIIRAAGTATLTTAGTAVRAEAPFQMIKKIEIVGNSSQVYQNLSGAAAALANFDRLSTGYLSSKGDFSTAPADAATGAKAIAAEYMVDFSLIRGLRPKDSALRSLGHAQLQLRITVGGAADLFTGSAVGTIAATIDVSAVQVAEVPTSKGEMSRPVFLKRISSQIASVPISSSGMEIKLPTGNNIKSIALIPRVSGEPSTAVLNNLIVQMSTGDFRVNLSRQAMYLWQLLNFGKPLVPGYTLFDFTQHGNSPQRMTDALAVQSVAEPKIVLDVNGSANTTIEIVTTELQELQY